MSTFKDLIYCLFKDQIQISTFSSNIFWCSKVYQRIVSGTIQFGLNYPFKDLIEISSYSWILFGVQMFVKKLYLVHYSLDPYCLSKDLIQISTESSYFFGVKNLFKKLYQGQYGSLNMVWPILSFQGSYTNVYLTLIYLLLLKIYWRIVSVPLWFDLCFLFQGFYQVFIKSHAFFLFQKSLRFKNFESQTIWFELYHLFRKQGSIFIKSTNRKLRPR